MSAKLAIALVLALLLAAEAQAMEPSARELLAEHLAAMQPYTSIAGTTPLEFEFAEASDPDNQRVDFHWQQGRFRQEYHWLGFTEVFAFDGNDHWYGSDLNLPYEMDTGYGIDVTPQLVGYGAYLTPAMLPYISEPIDLPFPAGEGYDVLMFSPPQMSQSLLLIDKTTHPLAGMVGASRKQLEDSSLFKKTIYGAWSDFVACPYPESVTVETLSGGGELIREKTTLTRAVEKAGILPDSRFARTSSPPVTPLELPENPYIVPFSYINENIVVTCLAPNGDRLKMELDTGANVGLLRGDLLEGLGLEPTGDETVTGHGGAAKVQYARAEGFKLEGVNRDYAVELPAWPAAVLVEDNSLDDSLKENGISGLLGNFILNNFVIKLDFRRKRLYLYEPDEFNPQEHLGDGYMAIPVYLDSMPYVEITVDGKIEGGAFFNTGARQMFSLNEWAAKDAGVEYEIESIATGYTVTGYTIFGLINPGEVRIGELVLDPPRSHLELLAPGEAPNPHQIASFGNSFFENYIVTFDLHGGMYYFEPI